MLFEVKEAQRLPLAGAFKSGRISERNDRYKTEPSSADTA